MGFARCRVSYVDSAKIEHAVEIGAESLYEAVALAVSAFKRDELHPLDFRPNTEFTVAVLRKPVEHKLRLDQVQKWAEPSMVGGPAAILKRKRVQDLLEG